MSITPDATIEEIISADKVVGQMLTSIGMQIENHTSETLRSVCQQLKWNEVEVLNWIKKNRISKSNHKKKQVSPDSVNFGKDIAQWGNHIVAKYHSQTLSLLTEITRDFPRILKVHGNQYSWLKDINGPLQNLDDKLKFYTYFMGNTLFPLLSSLNNENKNLFYGTIQKIERGKDIMIEDQNAIWKLMETIEIKGKHLENPEGACSTLRILNYNLKKLFSSIRKEFAIEQEIIIPLIEERLSSI